MVKSFYAVCICLIVLSCCFSLNAQNNKFHLINYEVEFRNSPNYASFGDLYFNSDCSFYNYWYKPKNILNSVSSKDLIKESDLNLDCNLFLKTDFKRSEILERTNAVEQIYDVLDTTFTINWITTGKTKILNELVCKEAYTIFRGRKYFAYYYPHKLQAGPWKLHGLPGIILYAYEENAFVVYKATKVNLIGEFTFDVQECKGLRNVEIEEYVSEVSEKAKHEYLQLFKSRLPAGARIESGEMLSREKAGEQELTYEWETPDNNVKKN